MKSVSKVWSVLVVVLLAGCSEILVHGPDENRNTEDFNSIAQLIGNRYAFVHFKHVNWDSLVVAYRPLATSAAGDEIYPVFHRWLGELKDGHIELRTEGGFPVITYKPPRFQNGKQYSPLVVRKYFDRELRLAGDGNMEYEILPGNIGYMYLSTFTDGTWINDFDVVLDYLRNTKAMIIDVRNNGGGAGNQVFFIVSRFIAVPVQYSLFLPDGTAQPPFTINPRGPFIYEKPVVILINGMSFSAAEMFPILLRNVPTVATVGDTTGGGGGANEVFTLPSGKRIRIPIRYFTKSNGEMVEWNGVYPDVWVGQTEEDVKQGRDKQLERAINLL